MAKIVHHKHKPFFELPYCYFIVSCYFLINFYLEFVYYKNIKNDFYLLKMQKKISIMWMKNSWPNFKVFFRPFFISYFQIMNYAKKLKYYEYECSVRKHFWKQIFLLSNCKLYHTSIHSISSVTHLINQWIKIKWRGKNWNDFFLNKSFDCITPAI